MENELPPLPRNYVISEGQVRNPHYGEKGHKFADKPALTEEEFYSLQQQQPQPQQPQ